MGNSPIRTSLFAVLLVTFAASVGSAREPVAKAYTPWDAAWQAHARSEQARLQAIDRQRQANDLMSWYGTYAPGYYRSPRKPGQRRYERSLSKSPIQVPFPGSPGMAYPSGRKVVPTLPYLNPSPPPVGLAVGHGKTWDDSSSYVYRPLYASDQAEQDEPSPAMAPRFPVAEQVPAPTPAPVVPEAIPTPPAMPEAIPTPAPE